MSSSTKDKLQLIIYNFSRNNYEDPTKNHVSIALKNIIIQFTKKIFESKILSFKQDIDFFQLLLDKLQMTILHKKLKLIYRASENNFTWWSFHNKCDGHGPTIMIMHSNYGNIFGGYVSVKLPFSNVRKTCDQNMFLFLLKSNDKTVKCPIIFKSNSKYTSIRHLRSIGPLFDSKSALYSELSISGDRCHTYKSDGFDYGNFKDSGISISGAPEGAQRYASFTLNDYEVFEII